jgi:hypothetical protein
VPTLLLAVVRWPAAAIVLAGLTGMGAAGIVVGSVIAPGLAALLGASGALIAVGGTVLGYALLVMRGTGDAAAGPASQPAMADAVPAR